MMHEMQLDHDLDIATNGTRINRPFGTRINRPIWQNSFNRPDWHNSNSP